MGNLRVDPLRLVSTAVAMTVRSPKRFAWFPLPDTFGRFDWIVGMYYADRTNWEEFKDCYAVDDDGTASLDVNYMNGGDRFAEAEPGQGALLPFGPNHMDPFGDQGDVSEGTYPECVYREIEIIDEGEFALYGELNYQFSDRLTGTIGYRRTDDTKSYGITAQVAEGEGTAFNFSGEEPEYKMSNNSWATLPVVNDNVTPTQGREGFRLGAGGRPFTLNRAALSWLRQLGSLPAPCPPTALVL